MKYFVAIVIVVFISGGIYWYARAKASTGNEAPAQQTAKVERATIERLVSANGIVASKRDVDIKCQASGEIQTLPYTDISAEVQAGALLCQLNTKDEEPLEQTAEAVVNADQARLAEAKLAWQIAGMAVDTTRQRDTAALDSAKAKASQAHSKADRTKQLFETKLESQEDLEADQTAADQADADVLTAQAALDELKQQIIDVDTKQQEINEAEAALTQDSTRLKTARLNLSYCKVTAPDLETDADKADPPHWFISSMLANISPGYIVQSGTSGFSAGTTIMTLSDLSHIFVLAQVDESDIGQVNDPEKGQAAQDVRVTVEAYPNEVFDGHVVRVAPKGVTTNNVTTFEVKIEVTGANRVLLRPQMTATAKVIIVSKPDVLTIPVAAFTREPRNSSTRNSTQSGASTEVASSEASGATSQPSDSSTPRRGRRGGRGQNTNAFTPSAIFGVNAREKGTVTILTDTGASETRDVTVGVTSGDDYEVLDGLSEGETVVLKSEGADSKWRGQNRGGSLMPRGLGGGGRRG